MASRTSAVGTFNTGDILTEAHVDSLPAGLLGYVPRTTSTSSVSSSTASDITGVTFSFTVNAGRLILLEFWCPGASTSDTTTYGVVNIQEGGTVLGWGRTGTSSVAGLATGPAVSVKAWWRGPAAGSHTIKATIARAGGSGSVALAAAGDSEMFLLAEDKGPTF